jgi:hypothetical protein
MKDRITLKVSDKSRLESSLNHRARYRRTERVSTDDNRPPVRLIIIYEGAAGLMRANEMWFRIASHFHGQIAMEACVWNFALLRDTRLSDCAALQAAEANVIVISPGDAHELPEHITKWIETSLPHDRCQIDAGGPVKKTGRSRAGSLLWDCVSRLASRANLGVFLNPRNRPF